MTMCYQHTPPGFKPMEKGPRLRSWEGDSPYFKNRPLRGPRGGDVLRLLRHPVVPNNIPRLNRITIHAFIKAALSRGSPPLHTAGLLVQSITNQRAVIHKAKTGVSQWSLVPGKPVSMTVDLRGEDMWHFMSKLITIVLPRIKDWRGIRATSGDSSGNLMFGMGPETVALFPEVETNYDSYPTKMIPGMHITMHTTATTDKDARMLLQQMGVPFWGKIVD
jgi:large subunit ribosomal protein L5